jgi:hypothetical protein
MTSCSCGRVKLCKEEGGTVIEKKVNECERIDVKPAVGG